MYRPSGTSHELAHGAWSERRIALPARDYRELHLLSSESVAPKGKYIRETIRPREAIRCKVSAFESEAWFQSTGRLRTILNELASVIAVWLINSSVGRPSTDKERETSLWKLNLENYRLLVGRVELRRFVNFVSEFISTLVLFISWIIYILNYF